MQKRSATATVALKTRMRAPLHAKLVKAAKLGKVSLNTEMLRRLEWSFQAAAAESLLVVFAERMERMISQTEQRLDEVLEGRAKHGTR